MRPWRIIPLLASALALVSCKEDAPLGNPPDYLVEVHESATFDYLLYEPLNRSLAENGRYPLIISLHGIGERGSDPHLLRRDGLPAVVETDADFPFYLIAPQCPATTEWYYHRTDTLTHAFIRLMLARYPIDPARVYLTGYSMGGIGTWDMAIRHPQWFAAIVPIAARRESYWDPCSMTGIPVRAFHGALDEVVPLAAGQDVVDAFAACGGDVKFTVYPESTMIPGRGPTIPKHSSNGCCSSVKST